MRLHGFLMLALATLACNGKGGGGDGGGADTADDCADGDLQTWYIDYDGDEVGADSEYTTIACEGPTGFVSSNGDCDDQDASVAPGLDEVCDGLDNDCNGVIDDASKGLSTFYPDLDLDGYGDESAEVDACEAPENHTDVGGDCDDTRADINPGAAELCNDGLDNDCSGAPGACELGLGDADVIFVGTGASDEAGLGMDGLGDLDGDGLPDLGIGARSADDAAEDAGMSYVFWSSTLASLSGQVALGDADLVISGAVASSKSGKSLTGGGDYDGDGTADLVVNAANFSITGTARGAFYLLYHDTATAGSASLSLDDADVRYDGESQYDYAGGIVRLVGDVNGSGVDAFLAGCVGDDDGASNAGAVYLMSATADPGTIATLSSSYYTAKILGESDSQAMGGAEDGAFNLDADGNMDIIVGSPTDATGGSNAGAAYLLAGPLTGSVSVAAADARLLGAAGDLAGSAVAGVGDVDSDGYSDVLVSAPYNDDVATTSGVAWLVGGRAALSDLDMVAASSAYAARMQGSASGDYLGAGLAGGGDSNGDGIPDLLIASVAAKGGAGAAYLFTGPLSGTLSTADASADLDGEATADGAGSPMRFVGDLLGGGGDSMLIGAPSNDRGATDAGAAYLVHPLGE